MKALKKLSCVLLAVLLLMSLSVNAFAASTDPTVITKHTLTVTDTRSGRTYVAYQILKGSFADIEGKKVLGDAEWGSAIAEDYKTTDIKTFIESFTGDEAARDLANALYPDHIVMSAAIPLTENEGVSYSVEDIDSGYYLIVDETEDPADPNTVEGVYTQYIVEVAENVDVTPKLKHVPDFEKKVEDINDSTGDGAGAWKDSADYDVGDSVPFQLKATLPEDYTEYRAYRLVFHDTLSTGLTFDEGSVKVYVNGSTEPLDTKYYSVAAGAGGESFTVTFANLKDAKDPVPGLGNNSAITVEYTATLSDGAVLRKDNKAHLEYSNDPNWDGEGTPTTDHGPDDTVVVFTYHATVNKVSDKLDENNKNVPLKGAEFTLEKWENGAWTYVDKNVASSDSTTFKFDGLDDGYYRLTETKTPVGYNSIDPIYFEVYAQHPVEDDGTKEYPDDLQVKLGSWNDTEKKVDVFKEGDPGYGDFTFTATASTGAIDTDIINQQGLVLPETGGIGTTIFYVVGGLLIAAAVVLLITKKRMTKEG